MALQGHYVRASIATVTNQPICSGSGHDCVHAMNNLEEIKRGWVDGVVFEGECYKARPC